MTAPGSGASVPTGRYTHDARGPRSRSRSSRWPRGSWPSGGTTARRSTRSSGRAVPERVTSTTTSGPRRTSGTRSSIASSSGSRRGPWPPSSRDARGTPSIRSRPFLDEVLATQRARNCVGGCPIGNLATELADAHEGFRQRLPDGFERWRQYLAAALARARALGALAPDVDPEALARFLSRRDRGRDPPDEGPEGHRRDGALRPRAPTPPRALSAVRSAALPAGLGR